MSERDAETAFDVAVIGERVGSLEPQETIEPALLHAAEALGIPAPTVRWVDTDTLARDGAAEHLSGADAVWCAPGSPYRSLDGALEGIRFARERGVPFIGTCAGFQHAVIEVARHVAGISEADHQEYGREGGDLVIHELLCSLVGQRLDVRVVDDVLATMYGAAQVEERYYCRFGLDPVYVPQLEAAGLLVAGVDVADDQPRVMRLVDHPFFVITLFVPQTSSRTGAPHPLVTALLGATIDASLSSTAPDRPHLS
ncbi:MAG: glutamine amidotransferase-related protein [Acidimicrobiales bacterium]